VGSFHHGTFAAFPAYPDIDLNSLLVAYLCRMGLCSPIPSSAYQRVQV
jgi:hypothetical protein